MSVRLAGLAAGAAAVAVAAVSAWPATADTGRLDRLAVATALAGVGTTALAVAAGWASLGLAAAVLLGASFVMTRFEEPAAVDGRVVAFAAGLYLLVELVGWCAESRRAALPGPPARALATTVALGSAGGVAVAALLVSVAQLPVTDDLAVAALGAGGIAAVGALFAFATAPRTSARASRGRRRSPRGSRPSRS